MFERRSGILLHPTSLPGPHGVGALGEAAFVWLEFLERAGQRLWQVMPLGPTGYGDSPYQSFSAFAGNPLLIDLELLLEDGLLTQEDLGDAPNLPGERVDYGAIIPFKVSALARAYARFREAATSEQRADFAAFTETERAWLDDFALFMTLKEKNGGGAWTEWPEAERTRDEAALARVRTEHAEGVGHQQFLQWLFFSQWRAVKVAANARGVHIIGDIPIFVAMDSADVWTNPELFYLDEQGNPEVIAGVPPDYFSATGQRWGNPLYRWDVMNKRGYAWWLRRLRSSLEMYDLVRIDHFRGFEAYWEIPASEPTAVKGRWVKGPGQALFDAIRGEFGSELPIIAEDLGVITPPVEQLRDDNALPGMKVLQFAFAADAADPYLPHTYDKNCVVYSGTHDNDTTRGWYEQAPALERDFARRYLGSDGKDIALDFVRLAFSSVADTAVVPMQDVLGLGSEARMNTPGVAAGNWGWRFSWQDVPGWLAPALHDMALVYGRLPSAGAVDTPYRQSVLKEGEAEEG